MKCFNHGDSEAVAACRGCGKGLCHNCCQTGGSGALVCSPACGEKTQTESATLALIRQKTLTQNRVSGTFSIMAGVIFGAFGLYHLTQPRFFLPLMVLSISMCIGLLTAGVMYLRVAKDKE
jgi:hypothetical protein